MQGPYIISSKSLYEKLSGLGTFTVISLVPSPSKSNSISTLSVPFAVTLVIVPASVYLPSMLYVPDAKFCTLYVVAPSILLIAVPTPNVKLTFPLALAVIELIFDLYKTLPAMGCPASKLYPAFSSNVTV